ncbi:MAG TPA: threonine/serine exporter family protein [Methylomirabilota bacterium]|nr:threonine/serine exporter family protein [Methylomirabilota bacterium]
MADDDATAFVLRLGRALHALGYSSHRIEEMLADAADRLGLEGQFFTTPTSIFSAFGSDERQRTFLVRVEPGDLHLERLGRVQAIAEEVLAGRLAPRAGLAALDALDREPPRWGVALTTVAFGIAGGSAACLLGGGGVEVAAAGALAMLTGGVAAANLLPPDARRFHEPLAAFVVSFAVSSLATRVPLSTYLATLGGLIVLLPGLTLSAAMSELNAQHLVSGTARLTGAIMRFLVLMFGVALGARVAQAAFGAVAPAMPTPLPAWCEWAAVLVAPFAFTVLMRARPVDAPAILGVCVAAVLGSRVGSRALGPELGVFAGALVAGLASNLLARVRHTPALVTLSPALLMLVPGSIGFRSLALLLDREVVNGIEAAFRMVIMFAALVAGLQVAGIAVPAPRLRMGPGSPR